MAVKYRSTVSTEPKGCWCPAGDSRYGSGPAPVFFGSGYIDQATWWRNGFIITMINLVIWLGAGGLWWKVIGLW